MANAGVEGFSVPIPRQSLSDGLTQEVLKLIRMENLKSGDRLPSVRVLAERFAVATPTMREALGHLKANGVLEMRHGSGVYVRNGQERVVLANPNRADLERRTVLELLDARMLIEPHLAGLAAEKVGNTEIAELEGLLREAERHLVGDDERLSSVNMDFHRAIARFSGNSILSQTIESLIELYSYDQLVILALYDDRSRDHRDHQTILTAIRDKDPGLAHRLMHRHILEVRSVIEGKLTENGPAMNQPQAGRKGCSR